MDTGRYNPRSDGETMNIVKRIGLVLVALALVVIVAACNGQLCGSFCCTWKEGGAEDCRSVAPGTMCLGSEHPKQVPCTPFGGANEGTGGGANNAGTGSGANNADTGSGSGGGAK